MVTKTVVISALAWTGLSTPLHFAWEVFHIRFYTLWQDAGLGQLAYALVHCTAGDAVIAFATFVAAAVGARDPDWPRRAPQRGLPVLLAAGLAYTAASEWVNVYELGRWAYSERMPTIAGIGATPIAQWLVVPLASFAFYRRLRPSASGR